MIPILTDEELYQYLRGERHNAVRARVFDEAYAKFPISRKAWCDRQIAKLKETIGLNDQEAKAFLAVLLIVYHSKPDEHDNRCREGETIRSLIEWADSAKRRQSKVWRYEQQVSQP
jgi:hypothetical protein